MILQAPEIKISALYYGNRNTNEALRRTADLQIPAATLVPPKPLTFGLEFIPALSPLLVRGKFNLVHETYFAQAYRHKSAKKVSTIHDVIPIERPEYANRMNRFFSKKNLFRQGKESDQIICVSEYTKARVIENTNVDPRKITVIPNGVTPLTEAYDADFIQKHRFNDTRFVLFIGNIEPRKNIAIVSNALKALGPEYDDVHFVVAGHMNYRAKQTLDYCKHLLSSRFTYLGHVSDAEKWTLLKSASAFVFPSLYEGFGIPVIEAYQAQCPTLMANNTSLTELCTDSRQLFDGQSVSSLASGIQEILNEPTWMKTCIERAHSKLEQYTWHSVATRTLDVYRRALDA